jgi:hypothetical protein
MRRTLTELAANPDLISGIYNYCDRWCERCPFTSRCLVYATEKEDEDESPENRDITNEAFWQKLGSVFQEAREMITSWAEEAGVDLTEIDEEGEAQKKKRHTDAARHQLALAGKEYANAVTEWFREMSQTITSSDVAPDETDLAQWEQFQDASEVIHWYQYQIAVKTMRSLSSRSHEEDPMEWEPDESYPKDSDGSAKVALVGMDRSINAWRLIQLCLPEKAASVNPLILRLEQLRQRTEREFPDARDFIRPGFDEVLGDAN